MSNYTVDTEAPSVHEQLSDSFVTIGSLPADDVAFASEAFGWDVVPTAEELETDHLRQAEDDRRNEDDLLSRYPGLANLDDAMLREIVGNPLAGLMADADEAIEAANILLRRRGTAA